MRSRIFMLSLVAALLAGCSETQTPIVEEEIIIPVSVMTAESSDIANVIEYAGQVTASETVSVVSKISGKVKAVFFEVGDRVSRNDVLFTLDEVDLLNQVRQLEGQLAVAEEGVKSAQNALASVTGGQFSSQVLQLESAVDNAARQVQGAELGLQNSEIALENATNNLDSVETSYNNVKTLYEAGAISKNEFDNAELGLKQAQAALEQAIVGNNSAKVTLEQAELAYNQAKDSLELTLGDVTAENLQKASLGVSQAEASRDSVAIQLDIARDTLNDSSIRAPMSGVISSRNARVGEYTSTQSPAFSIVAIGKVTVDVRVSEVLINLISPGQEVEVLIGSISDEPITGTVLNMSPASDMTGMYPVKIEIDNPDELIKPGMFARVRFIRASSQETIVLPRNTILEDESVSYVYIDNNGTAKRVTVTTGVDNGSDIEITSGLSVGDRVIVKGQTYVGDGDKINIVE